MRSLEQRVLTLEKMFSEATESISTIREVINKCPCEESRAVATLLIQAADPALFDIHWVMIEDSKGIRRGMTDIAEDLAAHHDEPFDWIKDNDVHGQRNPTKEKWKWVLGVCMLLSMAVELDHPNHDHGIKEIYRLLRAHALIH
jgi:hypothetical protein